MSKQLRLLLDNKAAKIKAARELATAAEAATGEFSAEQQTQYDAIMADITKLDASIARERALVEAERAQAAAPVIEQPAAPAAPGSVPRVTVLDPAPGAKLFTSFGDQLAAIVAAGTPNRSIDERLQKLNAAATGAGETIPSDGGFVVQTDFSTEILNRTYNLGEISSRVRRIPIGANSNGLTINAVDETSRVTGSRYGGVQAYWEGEGDSPAAKKPKFRKMSLKLSKLIALMYATDELLADSTAFEAIAQQAFAEEVNFLVEDAVIEGSGAGQPKGLKNSAAVIAVAKEAGQATKTLVYDNILKMWSRCWGRSRKNAVWFINQDIEPQLNKLSLPVGTGGVPVYLPANGASDSPYATLMGRPVVPIEYAETLGAQGDISLYDLSQYLMIDKGGPQAASSMHVRFIYDEMAFRITYRCDGQPVWDNVLTPFKGSNTLSPFVQLATR